MVFVDRKLLINRHCDIVRVVDIVLTHERVVEQPPCVAMQDVGCAVATPTMDLMHHWQPCFRTVSAILIVLSTVVAKDAISSFRVQSDPSADFFISISLLGWLKTCPEDLAKHAGAFLLMAAR